MTRRAMPRGLRSNWSGQRLPHSLRRKLYFFLATHVCLIFIIGVAIFMKYNSSSASAALKAPVVDVQNQNGIVKLLAPGQLVRSGAQMEHVQIVEMYWPIGQVPPGAIRDVSELKGVYAKSDLNPQLPILKRNLSHEKPASSVEPALWKRAVTINVDAETGIEYHIAAGSYVDVVLTHVKERKRSSTVVVENARVLSLAGDKSTVQERDKDLFHSKQLRSNKTVTLEVYPEEALRITTARDMGRLSLLLRATDDHKPLRDTEVNEDAIGSGNNPAVGQIPLKPNCVRGRVATPDGLYILECDGELVPVKKAE